MATGKFTYHALRTKTLKERVKTFKLDKAMLLVYKRLPLNHVFPYAQWA